MTTFNRSQVSDAERPGVRHNDAQNRFELDVDGGLAHLDYRREGDTLIFHHTYVPESARGQGHGARVVRAAMEFAQNGNFKVVPRCSYVASFLERYPQYQRLTLPN